MYEKRREYEENDEYRYSNTRVILILLGIYYAAIKAGIPYQDSTPELLKQYNHDMNIGIAMLFIGLGIEVFKCLYYIIIVICKVFKGKRKR